MAEIDQKIRAALLGTGFEHAELTRLTGDASSRRYFRVTQKDSRTAILMDARIGAAKDLGAFLKIGGYLKDLGFSAPAILADGSKDGFLLLEDFGDQRFADLPAAQETLYGLATDLLAVLQAQPPLAGLPICDVAHLSTLAATAWAWYPESAEGQPPPRTHPIYEIIETLSKSVTLEGSVVILRDYHAENLMWLAERDGLARVGLLDFQDAMIGHPAFDLVSLLQHARREVAIEIETDMIARFLDLTGLPRTSFLASYAALGAIRNLRIIGMFARLSRHLGRPEYLSHIPRVWGYLERDLQLPELAELRDLVHASLPAPTENHLDLLRQKCATIPTL